MSTGNDKKGFFKLKDSSNNNALSLQSSPSELSSSLLPSNKSNNNAFITLGNNSNAYKSVAAPVRTFEKRSSLTVPGNNNKLNGKGNSKKDEKVWKKKVTTAHSVVNVDEVENDGFLWDLIVILPNDNYQSYISSGKEYNTTSITNTSSNAYTDKNSSSHSMEMSAETFASRLSRGNLQYFAFYSVDKQFIIFKIRSSLNRFKDFASRTDSIKFKVRENILRDEIDDTQSPIYDDTTITHLQPYEFIYIKYRSDKDHIYTRARGYPHHSFSTCTRLNILYEMLRSPSQCDLNLSYLQQEGSIHAYFSLHDVEQRDDLTRNWFSWSTQPWNQPIDDIRDYFGAKIGLYFLFIGHYTTWLMYLSIASFICYIGIIVATSTQSYVYAESHAYTIPFYCIFVSFWCQFMLETWKRQEVTKAMEWGTTDFEEQEVERPEYKGILMPSVIDGKRRKYFSANQKNTLFIFSNFIISSMILLVIGCISLIFVMQYYVANAVSNMEEAAAGNLFAELINAIQIQVLNELYSKVAVWLTVRENHRTDTSYEDSLILKLFCFNFINSYSSLFYIAYIKSRGTGDSCTGSCMNELSNALAVIFVTRLVIGKIQLFVSIYFSLWWKERSDKKRQEELMNDGIIYSLERRSVAERELNLDPYDPIMGTLENYSELAIQFGYVTLFVASFPLAPVLAYVSNLVEFRADGYQMLYLMRRPIPTGAEDIGTWLDIYQIIAIIAVITNSGLLCFTMRVIPFDGTSLVWLFMAIQYAVFVTMSLLAFYIDDVPESVKIQLARQQYLVSRIDGSYVDYSKADDNVNTVIKELVINNKDDE